MHSTKHTSLISHSTDFYDSTHIHVSSVKTNQSNTEINNDDDDDAYEFPARSHREHAHIKNN